MAPPSLRLSWCSSRASSTACWTTVSSWAFTTWSSAHFAWDVSMVVFAMDFFVAWLAQSIASFARDMSMICTVMGRAVCSCAFHGVFAMDMLMVQQPGAFAIMCLPCSLHGSHNRMQLRTPGCSTQELHALWWQPQFTLWLPASQDGSGWLESTEFAMQ